jgi:hypothetical protein
MTSFPVSQHLDSQNDSGESVSSRLAAPLSADGQPIKRTVPITFSTITRLNLRGSVYRNGHRLLL